MIVATEERPPSWGKEQRSFYSGRQMECLKCYKFATTRVFLWNWVQYIYLFIFKYCFMLTRLSPRSFWNSWLYRILCCFTLIIFYDLMRWVNITFTNWTRTIQTVWQKVWNLNCTHTLETGKLKMDVQYKCIRNMSRRKERNILKVTNYK